MKNFKATLFLLSFCFALQAQDTIITNLNEEHIGFIVKKTEDPIRVMFDLNKAEITEFKKENIKEIRYFDYSSVKSVQPKSRKKKGYHAWVKTNLQRQDIKGFLYEVQDSQILLSNSFKSSANNLNKMPLQNIESVSVRKTGNVTNGIIIGSITGFAAGAAIGYISTKPVDDLLGTEQLFARTYALGFGGIGIIPGALIGGLIGAKKIKIPLNSNKKDYFKNKEELKKRAFKI